MNPFLFSRRTEKIEEFQGVPGSTPENANSPGSFSIQSFLCKDIKK